MKKIINKPENFVDETMEGIICAYGDRVKLLNGDKRILVTNMPVPEGKVGIVTAGGSGHLPVFLGYVGQGMLDGCAVGNVFASPSAQKMTEMIKACDHGSGVLCLYGNYGGDKMNFAMACEEADFDDIETRTVLVCDDVCSSPKETAERRRGVAGMVYAFKLAGAAAEKMMTLDEVADVAQKALNNTRTMGVALSPCIVPEVGKPTFSINDDEIELGMGIHGEPGVWNGPILTADEIAKESLDTLLGDMPVEAGEEVCLLINGLGASSIEELYILCNSVRGLLDEKGIKVYRTFVGEYATSMEMAGASISICRMADDEMKEKIDLPVKTPFYTQA